MTQLIEALSYPFVQRAIAAGVMISLCAALLGVILVLKQYSLIGHGLGDVGFASTSLAVALGLPVMAVSIPIVVVAACLIMFWLFRLPLAYFLSTTLGKDWLYMCYPISWVLGLSITGIYFLRGKWRKKVKISCQ